jgi:dTMP kinase
MPTTPQQRGLLVSAEGITGSGKTYLIQRMLAEPEALKTRAVELEEFSRRPSHGELGHDILAALAGKAGGDRFLRGGRPATETLLLLAIKTYDYEAHCAPALRRGRLVFEGRSLHSIAVYQSLILYPGDDEKAFEEMRALLDLATQWRPLPDVTFLVMDDVNASIERAERRDRTIFSPQEKRFHYRAAELYDRLATDICARVDIIDRRMLNSADAIAVMRNRINTEIQASRGPHSSHTELSIVEIAAEHSMPDKPDASAPG